MSRYLLDTSIISNVTRPVPSRALIDWMAVQSDDDLFISALSIAEIWRGVLEKPAGRKRQKLEHWFLSAEGPQALFGGRVLPFDLKAGLIWGRLMTEGARSGRPRDPFDMIVAAIAEANQCTVVTDNERHFAGLNFINPTRSH